MKRKVLRLFCAVFASLIVASNLILAVAAAEIFNYDKFVNDPRYEVRAETRNNATWTNWGNSDKEVWTDSGERLLLYYLFNARDAKEKAGYRLFDQVVHLRYKLPSQFTSLYTQNRTYRYYIAHLRNGNNDVKDNIIDINGDGFEYMYSYEDYNKAGDGGAKPGETNAYFSGYVTAGTPNINIYHLKYGSNTPTMEEAAQREYEDLLKKKEGNSYEKNTVTLERRDGGDCILLIYHEVYDNSSNETAKHYARGTGSDVIEETKYEEIHESYEYYYFTRIPGLSDVYSVNHTWISRLYLYTIGLKSPRQEAIDLYNDQEAKWKASVAMAPDLYSMMPVIEPDEPNIYDETVRLNYTTRARVNAGEDEGVSVPTAILIGTGAAVAAIGAAGAAAGGSSADDRKKAFKMYVQKDFADAIRRGAPPVKVRARMAEVDETGAEHDRNDLTVKITAEGKGLTVSGAVFNGRYFEATVSAPENAEDIEGSVIFTFTGEGGVFTNTVVFRLVDGPSLAFVEDADKPGEVQLNSSGCTVNTIPGDGFTYVERFMIVDATVEPPISAITSDPIDGYTVRFEKAEGSFLYRMIVKNDTPAEPEHDVFAEPKDLDFTIRVAIEGEKEPVEGYVTVKQWPEGISVRSRDKGEKNGVRYVRVQSYEKEYYGDLDKPWQVSEMILTLAVKGKDRALIDPEGVEYKFEKLKGSGKGKNADKEEKIAEKYAYKEAYAVFNDRFTYTFEPQTTLWEPTDGTFFIVNLPAVGSYDGIDYKAEIPLRLRGKDIDPMEAWEEEYKKTRSRIERFCPPDQVATQLQKLEEIAETDTCRISTTELRLMSKDILRAYMDYWTKQHENDEWYANSLDWAIWGLEWVKWIGDCAFSYVVAAYTGPCEAIITPAKEVLVSALGEVGVNIVWGTEFNPDNLPIAEQLKNAGDNFVSGWTSDKVTDLMSSPGKIKMACAVMGGYFAYAVLNNYLQHMAETGESDFYGAIMGAFKDLTVTAVKIAAGALLKKWLASESFKQKIGPKIQEFMQKKFGDNLKDQKLFNYEQLYNQSQELYGDLALKGTFLDHTVEATRSGIVEKFFTELCGEGAAKIHEKANAEQLIFSINEMGDIIFTFCIWQFEGKKPIMVDLNLSKVVLCTTCGLFGWMYSLFFDGVPTADAVMEIPKDPPLPAPGAMPSHNVIGTASSGSLLNS